jgi:VWFA-related protein
MLFTIINGPADDEHNFTKIIFYSRILSRQLCYILLDYGGYANGSQKKSWRIGQGGVVRKPVLYSLMLLVCTLVFDSRITSQQGPVVHTTDTVDVNAVSLNVTVTNAKSNTPVTNLNPDELIVYEDGVRQKVSYFSCAQTRIVMSLLIDSSSSMQNKTSAAQSAALEVIKNLRSQDMAQVVAFTTSLAILQDFTSDKALLEGAVKRTWANGATSLYNTLYVALRRFPPLPRSAKPEEIPRHVMVVLSDGEDTKSILTHKEVLEVAKRSGITFYTINVRNKKPTRRELAKNGIEQFALETGGQAFFSEDTKGLPAIYRRISEEITGQYRLTYIPSNTQRNGRWRQIKVQATRLQVVARAKTGYYEPL